MREEQNIKELVGIKGIRDNIVITNDQRYVTLLEVDGINFSLKNEEEQDLVLNYFEKLLIIGDEFKFQIVRKNIEVNMESEIEKLDRRISDKNINNENKALMRDYRNFLLAMSLNAFVKKNYLVISYDKYAQLDNSFLKKLFKKNKKIKFTRNKERRFKEASYMLSKACNRLVSEYLNVGCRVKRLDYNEIVNFYKSHFRSDHSNRLII
ncbi:MAG: hypothetical protein KKC53_03930 [Actinobacteria bacterium]|nr:hypothetical protein [Actinomycetota bacterium]